MKSEVCLNKLNIDFSKRIMSQYRRLEYCILFSIFFNLVILSFGLKDQSVQGSVISGSTGDLIR